jgi:hypothetical protein
MKKLTVFDPAMCCDTGVCGVDADATLITFSADMDWLQKNGVSVNRFNLAQEPAAFISDPLVKAEINQHGETCLPLLVLDGEVINRGVYPDRQQLQSLLGLGSPSISSGHSVTKEDTASCGCGSNNC